MSVNTLALQVQFGLYSFQLSLCFTLREVGQVIVLRSSFHKPVVCVCVYVCVCVCMRACVCVNSESVHERWTELSEHRLIRYYDS